MRSAMIGMTCAPELRSPAKSELYFLAIEHAGAQARFIEPDSSIETVLKECDGLLIPGGLDVDPSRYGERMLFPCTLESTERTDFEAALVYQAYLEKVPVFGICYGMQLMNIVLGGTLFQDISAQLPNAINHRQHDHRVTFHQNPIPFGKTCTVNSSHHQSVKTPGTSLVPFCFAEDGVIEAFYGEGGHPFFIGVQWHPERNNDRISEFLFRSFVEACIESR